MAAGFRGVRLWKERSGKGLNGGEVGFRKRERVERESGTKRKASSIDKRQC